MNKGKYIGIGLGILAVLAFVFSGSGSSFGSAPSGLAATVATTTQYTVGTTAVTAFATTTNCSSRVISTVAQPIMITFTDQSGQVPTALFGHLQSASTTVVYDAGIYGCNAVKIYGFNADSVITLTETR